MALPLLAFPAMKTALVVSGVAGALGWSASKAEGFADKAADAAKWSAVGIGVYYAGRYVNRQRRG